MLKDTCYAHATEELFRTMLVIIFNRIVMALLSTNIAALYFPFLVKYSAACKISEMMSQPIGSDTLTQHLHALCTHSRRHGRGVAAKHYELPTHGSHKSSRLLHEIDYENALWDCGLM